MATREENRNILIGAAVLLALLAGVAAIHVNSARQQSVGYPLLARFNKAEGVVKGTRFGWRASPSARSPTRSSMTAFARC